MLNMIFIKHYCSLHKNNPALRAGDRTVSTQVVRTNANDVLMVYLRRNEDNEVLIILNFSKHTIDCVIEDELVKGIFKNVFTGDTACDTNQQPLYELQPGNILCLKK